MNKRNIRILFLSVSAFLVLQLMCIWKVSEPYPALRLPGFGKIPQNGGKVSTTKYEVVAYASGDSLLIKSEELFYNVPKHYIPNLLNNLLQKRTRALKSAGRVSNTESQKYQHFQSWIAKRLHERYKIKYDKVVINKYAVSIDSKLTVSAGGKSLVKSTSILLP